MKILVDKELLERVTEQLEHYMGDFRSDACIALRNLLAHPAPADTRLVEALEKIATHADTTFTHHLIVIAKAALAAHKGEPT